jgi:hypothetical protein
MHRKRRSQTLTTLDFTLKPVIARALSVIAWISLAAWAHADTLYTDKTDSELTELAAGWESLSEDERRALLTEIKARMHTNSDKVPVLTIQTERRYGRIVRQPDGSLVRIETTEHIVRYQPLPADAGDRQFGVGFEQRTVTGGAQPPQSPTPPPSAAPPNAPPVPVMQVGAKPH